MKIVFTGGGTMGHISPALAVAEAIRKNFKNAEILFIGRSGGEENKAITNAGYKLKTVEISGIERKVTIGNAKKICAAVKAISDAKKIIKDFSPDIVFGTGGYVSFPALYAAQKLSIPTVIHESNASPGLVTKLLSKKCNKLLLNYPGSESEFTKKENITIVGNPVKEAFMNTNREIARRRLGIKKDEIFISSYGGSGGSQKLNESVIEIMKNHSSITKSVKHIHSCGEKYYRDIAKQFPEFTKSASHCKVVPYIENMADIMYASDIVISRCGAVTLSEISAVGAPAILIPSPNVTDNHQYKNAKFFSEMGGAILIEENELSERTLLDALKLLETNKELRDRISKKIHSLYNKESVNLIINEIKSITKYKV